MPTTELIRRLAARLKIVDEHVARENQHNLEGILRAFGTTARYDDEPRASHYIGRRIVTAIMHPLTAARTICRMALARRRT